MFYHPYFDADGAPQGDIHVMYNNKKKSPLVPHIFASDWNTADYSEAEDYEEFSHEMLKEWTDEKGYDFSGNEDNIFDMAVCAVSELHSENFFEKAFGKKIPVIINGYELYYMTAVRSAKANGRELFDRSFFDECGIDKW